jgi:hypothetical protein
MYPLVVLSLLAVALLVFGRAREGLEATTTIKAPPYDQAEKDRIWGMLGTATKDRFKSEARGQDREAAAKNMAADYVSDFFSTYATSTTPITESIVNNWVRNLGLNSDRKSAVEQLLKVYYVYQAGSGTTAGGTGTTAGGTGTTTTGGAAATGATGGTANTGAGSATPNTSATPNAPAGGTYAQLKTQFETKQKEYNGLLRSVATATDPPTADIEKLRSLNRELAGLIEQIIQVLSSSQSAEMERISRELGDTLVWVEKQYGVLSADSDKVETLRRIREFEQVRADGSISLYLIVLIGLAVALLVTMIFSQRVSTTTAMPPTSPASTPSFM